MSFLGSVGKFFSGAFNAAVSLNPLIPGSAAQKAVASIGSFALPAVAGVASGGLTNIIGTVAGVPGLTPVPSAPTGTGGYLDANGNTVRPGIPANENLPSPFQTVLGGLGSSLGNAASDLAQKGITELNCSLFGNCAKAPTEPPKNVAAGIFTGDTNTTINTGPQTGDSSKGISPWSLAIAALGGYVAWRLFFRKN